MNDEKQPIGVVGVGWVGLVTATCFAELGHKVIALDIVEEKVESLRRGEVAIHEPGLAELLAKNVERLEFTTSMDDLLAGAQLLFCCVDTPPTYSGDADLSRVRSVVEQLPEGSRHALVMKSTVPSGTGAAIRRDRPELAYVSCPEFLREGSAIHDFMNPDRVVIGADPGSDWAAEAVEELYRPLGAEMVRTDVASAEMIKLASNAFLATKISFINEIANVCEQTGADVTEVARGMGLDKRIGPSFLRAGVGYGGSCFLESERLWVRRGTDGPEQLAFSELWARFGGSQASGAARAPGDLRALSWVPGEEETEWMPVSLITARAYDGEVTAVTVADGQNVSVTADHPFVGSQEPKSPLLVRLLASELTTDWWLPTAETTSSSPIGASERYPGDSRRYQCEGGQHPSLLVAERSAAQICPVSWSRVVSIARSHYSGYVYSLKVPGSETVVVNDGLVVNQCFPKDTQALKQLAGNAGYHFQLLNAVIEVNELQKRRVVAKLEKHLGTLVGKRIALLGLAFKPDTDDMREATSLVLSARLQGEGAQVIAYDPVAERSAAGLLPNVAIAESATDALKGADAAVLVTEWPEFAELDWAGLRDGMATPLVVDGRNFLDPEALRAAGFTYEGIGRPNGDA